LPVTAVFPVANGYSPVALKHLAQIGDHFVAELLGAFGRFGFGDDPQDGFCA
jgi:hypothetical protein